MGDFRAGSANKEVLRRTCRVDVKLWLETKPPAQNRRVGSHAVTRLSSDAPWELPKFLFVHVRNPREKVTDFFRQNPPPLAGSRGTGEAPKAWDRIELTNYSHGKLFDETATSFYV